MEELNDGIPLDVMMSDASQFPTLLVRDGVIRACNAAARNAMGERVTPGMPLAGLFPDESAAKLERHAGRGAWGTVEVQILLPREEEPRPVGLFAGPCGDGLLIVACSGLGPLSLSTERRLMAINDELTNATRELARSSDALRRAKEELENVAALRDEYMAIMSHDLRTPLSIIKLQATYLRKTAADSDTVQRAGSISAAAERIAELATSVLDAARLESGTMDMAAAPVPLADVARRVADAVRPIGEEAGVAIELRAPSSGLVRGDARRLEQVVTNLVENAIRHAPRGSVVDIDIEERAGRAVLSVRDRGAGIPASSLPRLFQRYRRLGGEQSGAAGLGLYIARRLVEEHGGRISAEDARPGARFVVELPLQQSLTRSGVDS